MKTRLLALKATARQRLARLRSVELVLKIVCQHYCVSLTELGSGKRQRRIAWPRHLAMYFVHRRARLTQSETAFLFSCGSSNIAHALEAVENEVATSCAAGREVSLLSTAINHQLPQLSTPPQ